MLCSPDGGSCVNKFCLTKSDTSSVYSVRHCCAALAHLASLFTGLVITRNTQCSSRLALGVRFPSTLHFFIAKFRFNIIFLKLSYIILYTSFALVPLKLLFLNPFFHIPSLAFPLLSTLHHSFCSFISVFIILYFPV